MVPPPSGTYETSEIKNRITSGSTKRKVYLSLGPNGTRNGSYFFRGSETASTSLQDNCLIFFSNDNLDLGVPKRILLLLYTYDSEIGRASCRERV